MFFFFFLYHKWEKVLFLFFLNIIKKCGIFLFLSPKMGLKMLSLVQYTAILIVLQCVVTLLHLVGCNRTTNIADLGAFSRPSAAMLHHRGVIRWMRANCLDASNTTFKLTTRELPGFFNQGNSWVTTELLSSDPFHTGFTHTPHTHTYIHIYTNTHTYIQTHTYLLSLSCCLWQHSSTPPTPLMATLPQPTPTALCSWHHSSGGWRGVGLLGLIIPALCMPSLVA